MFSNAFQEGSQGVELLSNSGTNPSLGWKISANIHRVYDKSSKGFIYLLDKPKSATLQLQHPNGLGLIQRFLIFQLKVSHLQPLNLEIIFVDQKQLRRRIHVSSSFSQFESHELHAQVPFSFVADDAAWISLVMDLELLSRTCFTNCYFTSLDYICIRPNCKVRKIFTLPSSSQLDAAASSLDTPAPLNCPPQLDFPIGVVTSGMQVSVFIRWLMLAVYLSCIELASF